MWSSDVSQGLIGTARFVCPAQQTPRTGVARGRAQMVHSWQLMLKHRASALT